MTVQISIYHQLDPILNHLGSGVSIAALPSSDWPVGHCPDCSLMEEGAAHFQQCHCGQTDDPGLDKKAR